MARVALSYRPDKIKTAVREYLDAFIVAGLVALFLITFVIRTFYIPTESMLPTLQSNDVVLVNEFEYRMHAPQRGDVVVFKPPIPSPSNFIKRIVAIPGDTLRIFGGAVYVDGKRLSESYVTQPPAYDLQIKNYGMYVDDGTGFTRLTSADADIPPRAQWQAPDRVPAGFYVTLGDNRNDSDDSHVWGFARGADFAGRAFLLLWPLSRLHVLGR